ncbi:hypothetical protein BVRB_7g179090 [Beta vulgaris subsp. vulgaris]|uniref:Uncharacterized protein n=1 Tax=Beta vulgaris subsp. vulgaris TaxID=3555 RepID=A0A0J8BAQ6_BETVV|nr:hypothetical protein BVRB_7g179090 [Beta vulgaris subsp. vulgaris]
MAISPTARQSINLNFHGYTNTEHHEQNQPPSPVNPSSPLETAPARH